MPLVSTVYFVIGSIKIYVKNKKQKTNQTKPNKTPKPTKQFTSASGPEEAVWRYRRNFVLYQRLTAFLVWLLRKLVYFFGKVNGICSPAALQRASLG